MSRGRRRGWRVLGPDGRTVASAWDGSGQGRRAQYWQPTRASINALLAGDVETLRARTRDEVRRNPWAKKAIASFVANLIGTGILPKPRTQDRELKAHILDAFYEWAEECDADGVSSFWGQQELVARAWAEGGEAFVRFRHRRMSDGLSVPLQLQVLEAEMVDPTKSEVRPDGSLVRAGIEVDRIGRRRAYWMHRWHPGEDVMPPGASAGEVVPVPASEVLHVYHVMRPGQVRGVPGLATVLAMLHEIRELDDAHVARSKIQNLYATFEEVPADDAESALPGEDDDDQDGTDEDEPPRVTAEPASHVVLPPGHKISFGQPPTGATDYAALIKVRLRAIAAGANVTYEQISGDLSDVNFSSIRAGLVELQRELEQMQRNVLIQQFLRLVWRRWLETAVLVGRVVIPEGVELRPLLRARWQPPGWSYVEPEKEVRAAVRRVRAGLSTREIECARTGLDIEEVDIQRAAEIEREQELGLVLTTNPRMVSDAGVGHANDPERFREEDGAGGAGGDGEGSSSEEDEDAA